MTTLFKGLRTLSFFDFGTFFLFAEESDELPVAEGQVLWNDLSVPKSRFFFVGWSCRCLRVDATR